MVLFPPGEVLPWDFFRGGGGVAVWYYFPLWKFCYGISSGGRFAIMYGNGGGRAKNSYVTPAPLSKQVSLTAHLYYHGFGDLVVT